jgi:putative nucleotidyltransferase with HDIG domain
MQSQLAMRLLPGLYRETRDRQQWVPVYTSLVALVGLLLFVVAWSQTPTVTTGLLLFACMAFLSDILSVPLFNSSRVSRVSVAGAIGIASIVVFGPWGGVLTLAGCSIATSLASLRTVWKAADRAKGWRRLSFNFGMFVTSAWAAGLAFTAFGGVAGQAKPANLLPLVGASIVYYVTNLALLTGVLSLQTNRTPWKIWFEDFMWHAPITILTSIVGGGLLALAFLLQGELGAAIFAVPILATSYAFKMYTDNMRPYVANLEKAKADLEEANLGLLESLGSVIDAYDVYTAGHSRQVADYASVIAAHAGLSKEEQLQIRKAALIHDVGKVGVADSIISKQDRLTPDEYTIVKRHPQIGAEIVGQMKGLQDLVPLIRHHHERWDGRGYPDGLAGGQIHQGARILALADTLDAMCSDRPHRPGLSLTVVLAEIQAGSGTQFDPALVDVLLDLVAKKGAGFVENSALGVDQQIPNARAAAAGALARHLKKSMLLL